MISPFAARISQCSSPTAFCSLSSDRNELEQTISASMPVRWAKVSTLGRISWITTSMPASAACQAASDPAMPPPTICNVSLMRCQIGQRRARCNDRLSIAKLPIDSLFTA